LKQQQIAADSVGFNEGVYTQYNYENEGDTNSWGTEQRVAHYENKNDWAQPSSRNYLDPQHFLTAWTADDLAQQYEFIDDMDRTTEQKAYLYARQDTRYWLSQINDRNGMDKFITRYTGADSMDVRAPSNVMSGDHDMAYRYSWMIDSIQAPNQLMPWSIPGETTFLPEGIDYTPDPDYNNRIGGIRKGFNDNKVELDKLDATAAAVDQSAMLWEDAFPDWMGEGWDAEDEVSAWEKAAREQSKKDAEAEAERLRIESEIQPDEEFDPTGDEPPNRFTYYPGLGPIETDEWKAWIRLHPTDDEPEKMRPTTKYGDEITPEWTAWRERNPGVPSAYDEVDDGGWDPKFHKPEEDPHGDPLEWMEDQWGNPIQRKDLIDREYWLSTGEWVEGVGKWVGGDYWGDGRGVWQEGVLEHVTTGQPDRKPDRGEGDPKDPKYDYPDVSKGGRKKELFEDWKYHNEVTEHGMPLYGLTDDELWEIYINRKGEWVPDGKDHLAPDNTPREQYFQDHMFDDPFVPYEDYLLSLDADEGDEGDAPVEDVEDVEDAPDPGLPAPISTLIPDIPDVHLTQFQQYLQLEHHDEFLKSVKHPTRMDHIQHNFAKDDAGNIVLGGDPGLEAQLGLPDYIAAVRDPKSGEVVEMYDSSKVQPP
jgi:hypothetical protein